MINISIDSEGKPSISKINIGNQWENLDEEIVFSLPDEFKDYNKYVVAYIKDKKTKEEITRLYPIQNNKLMISSGLTKISGDWHLYVLCKTSPVDLSGDTVDISAKAGEHISISDEIVATINANSISSDVFQNASVDENIKIIYDELSDLYKEVEKSEAVRVENENERKVAEQKREENVNTAISNLSSSLTGRPSSDTIAESDTIITNINSETKQITLSNFIEAIKGKVDSGGSNVKVSFDTSTGNLQIGGQ